MWVGSERSTLCASANEESGTLADNTPLTGYEPKIFDDYHISETSEIFIQESSSNTRPSNLHDSEISDYTIGRALSSPLLTQEGEEPADRGQAHHSPEKVCCRVSRCLSVMLEQGDMFLMSLVRQFQTSEKIHVATQKRANQDSSGTTKKADSC